MKKLALILGLSVMASGAFAQGLINFLNNSTTLVTLSSNSVSLGSTPATAGLYYYGLFTAAAGTTDPTAFTFSGALATNQASAGRFSGGVNVAVSGMAAGSTHAIMVVGWDATWGNNWNNVLANIANNLNATKAQTLAGYFGYSAVAPNFIFGGFDGTATIPTSPAFGGVNGIQSGFTLNYLPVPEPSTFALAGLSAAAMLIFRRRK